MNFAEVTGRYYNNCQNTMTALNYMKKLHLKYFNIKVSLTIIKYKERFASKRNAEAVVSLVAWRI